MYAFLCVLRAKCPAHFLLFCLCHPNNVLWMDKEIELREHYAACSWCLCVSVSVSDRSRFQRLNHLTDVQGILCRNYATGGRFNPKFPTPSSDNMADIWTCEVGCMIVPLGLGLWTYVVIDVLKTSTFPQGIYSMQTSRMDAALNLCLAQRNSDDELTMWIRHVKFGTK